MQREHIVSDELVAVVHVQHERIVRHELLHVLLVQIQYHLILTIQLMPQVITVVGNVMEDIHRAEVLVYQ